MPSPRGRARRVLVVGVEKMTEVGRRSARILIKAAYLRRKAPSKAALPVFSAALPRCTSSAMATIGRARPHRRQEPQERRREPLAQLQKDLGFEFCRTVSDKNPLVAGPLRRTDCSLVSDGAAALVLADVDTALASARRWCFAPP